MDMNDDTPTHDELDDLAVYVLDAHDPGDTTGIESYLLARPADERWEQDLREAAGAYAAAGTADVDLPPDLRDRVLTAALAARPAGQPIDATPATPAPVALPSPEEVHRREQQRGLEYLRSLQPDDWSVPVDPPELAGWSVHDVVAHLAANATLLADTLGVPVAGVPETALDNEGRTAAAQARHRGLPPSAAIDEFEAAARAVEVALAAIDARGTDPGLAEEVDWWGVRTPIGWVLMVRAFETWTHTDDIRRALGQQMQPPPPPSLRTMSRSACGLMPLMLAVQGEQRPGEVVRVRFTDMTDTAWDVDLGEIGVAHVAGSGPVDAEIALGAVDLCRAIGNRLSADGLAYTSSGDADLARVIVDATPALAVL